MKICFVIKNLNTTDGGGRFSYDLVSNLRKVGEEVSVLTHSDILKNPWINFFKIRKILKNSDIIHAVDIWPNGFYARLISLWLKKPVVVTALGTYSVAPFYSWRRPLAKWVLRTIQLTVISNYTKEKILEIIPNLDIKVICPGFDLGFWSGEQPNNDEIVGLKPYILSVGALKSRKGYLNSIAAFIIAAKKTDNLNYVIIGQGEESGYAKKLKKIIRENHLEKRVFFISDGIDDKKLLGFYRNAELFVLTPIEENHHFEGFGIVYLEAAASGLPIIASWGSGAESAVSDGFNGILTPQNNPEAAADVIVKIISNRALKSKFENNSREWVKNFSWDKVISSYTEIYNAHVKHN